MIIVKNGIVKFTCPHITMKWPVQFTSTTVCKYINLREKCGLRSVTVVILIFQKKDRQQTIISLYNGNSHWFEKKFKILLSISN